ncbi:hypothetical protein Tco_0413303 [Tanacetum coccineum]
MDLHLTPMVTDPPRRLILLIYAPPRKNLTLSSNDEENKLEMADTQLKSSQSKVFLTHLPIYSIRQALQRRILIMWKCICRSCRNLQQRKEDQFDEYLNAYVHLEMRPFMTTFLFGEFPPTQQPLRTTSNSNNHATVHDGQIVTEPIQKKAPGMSVMTGARGKKSDMFTTAEERTSSRQDAKEKVDELDAEAEAFLADLECTAPYNQPQD